MFMMAWVYYPIAQRHEGDFLAMLSHRSYLQFWNGEGLGYGPIFALYDLALRPLADLPAMRLMYVINLGLMVLAFWLMSRTFCRTPDQRWELHPLLPGFLMINFYPIAQIVRQNNIEITELAFLSGAFYYYSRRRDLASGICFGLAASTKLLPIFLFPYFVWRRRWKVLGTGLATTAAMFGGVGLIKGVTPAGMLAELASMSRAEYPLQWINNQAVSGFMWRLVSDTNFHSGGRQFEWPIVWSPELATVLTALGRLTVAGLVLAMFLRRNGFLPARTESAARWTELVELQIALLAILMLLPYNHTHYYALAFPAFLIAATQSLRETERARIRRYLPIFAVAYATGVLAPLRLFDGLAARFVPCSALELAKMVSLPFAGAVLTLIGLLYLHGQLFPRGPLAASGDSRKLNA